MNKIVRNRIFLIFIFLIIIVMYEKTSEAQNWQALPPYNTLWPLWSPALSPIDIDTGLPTPIVTSLTPSTILPIQPGLTWHPSLGYPWLLYNTPLGMAYYDPYKGINLWPASFLINVITGLPIELTLADDYAYLAGPPFLTSWLISNVPGANSNYQTAYASYYTTSLLFPSSSATAFTATPPPVLSAYDLLGFPVGAATPVPIILYYPLGNPPAIPLIPPIP